MLSKYRGAKREHSEREMFLISLAEKSENIYLEIIVAIPLRSILSLFVSMSKMWRIFQLVHVLQFCYRNSGEDNCLAVISMNVWLSQMSVYESIQFQIDTDNTAVL